MEGPIKETARKTLEWRGGGYIICGLLAAIGFAMTGQLKYGYGIMGDTGAFALIAANIIEKGELYDNKRAPAIPLLLWAASGPISFEENMTHHEKAEMILERGGGIFTAGQKAAGVAALLAMYHMMVTVMGIRSWIALVFAFLAAISETFMRYNQLVCTEALVIYGFIIMFGACAFIVSGNKSRLWFAALALSSIFLSATRADAFMTVLFILGVLLALDRRSWRAIGAIALVSSLIPAHFSWRNHQNYGSGGFFYSIATAQVPMYILGTDMLDEANNPTEAGRKLKAIWEEIRSRHGNRYSYKEIPFAWREISGTPEGETCALGSKAYYENALLWSLKNPMALLKDIWLVIRQVTQQGYAPNPEEDQYRLIHSLMDYVSRGMELLSRLVLVGAAAAAFLWTAIRRQLPPCGALEKLIIGVGVIFFLRAALYAPLYQAITIHYQRFMSPLFLVQLAILAYLLERGLKRISAAHGGPQNA